MAHRQPNILLVGFLMLWTTACFAQMGKYEANWESLDSRPVAEWFSEAKFGIFIHWGPSSVPSWSPKGTYEEWYQRWFTSESIFGNGTYTGQEIPEFHKKTYGDDFNYYDFAKIWKAEQYDPKQWAALFKKAGAKYVIMTSKHHDGFALWPNQHASQSRGFHWNSMDTGPRRDLVGDYMKAIKQAGLKAGLYYSLYEWYHPWYQEKLDKFVTDLYHPQFKELVINYEPDVIYADGEWEQYDDYWRSTELLAWLFNESPVKETVVINDRWEKDQRHKHGGYFTTEYLRESLDIDKPWEEIRGMGLSFGYNRNEDIEDYSSAKALVLMLVDIVSQGGNFCLNVGPTAAGKIPVIMQERLVQIGEWLDVNGEAIYGSQKWERSCQWSAGDREHELLKEGQAYVEGSYILEQTVDPPPGKAVKEVFFTKKGDIVYAIVPRYPKGSLLVKDIVTSADTEVSLLGHGGVLTFSSSGRDLVIEVPLLTVDEIPCHHAWTFKITNVR